MKKIIEFKYDEFSLVEDTFTKEEIKEMDNLGFNINRKNRDAYELFMDDDGNEFKSAEINKGIIYGYSSILEILDDMLYELPELITDFRDYIKEDFEYNSHDSQKHMSSIIFNRDEETFYENMYYGKNKILTLSQDEYDNLEELLSAIMYVYDDNNGFDKNDIKFIETISKLENKYLNKEEIEKRLMSIIRNKGE